MSENVNIEVTESVVLFNGTRLDVFNTIEILKDKLDPNMYHVFDKDLEGHPIENIEKRHDIRSGDVLPFISPIDGNVYCVGFDLNTEEDFKRAVFLVGSLQGYDDGMAVELFAHSLVDDLGREIFDTFLEEVSEGVDEIRKDLKDVLLVEATKDEFYNFIEEEQSKTNEGTLLIEKPPYTEDTFIEVNTLEDIESGYIISGQSEREDGSLRLGFVGYDVKDEDLQFLVEGISLSLGVPLYKKAEVTRVGYKDRHAGHWGM